MNEVKSPNTQSDAHSDAHRRPVRSYVRRQGRMTIAQSRALKDLHKAYLLTKEQSVLNQEQVFGRTAPLIMEIGFGMGEGTLAYAQQNPQKDIIGVEVHEPGVGALMHNLEKAELKNVRIYSTDAIEVLREAIAPGTLEALHLFFPDPWPKKRHHKRRIVQPEFLALVASRLKPGGRIHMATDWQAYADWMLEMLTDMPGMTNLSQQGDYIERPDYRPETRFERRGHRLGHGVWDLLFEVDANAKQT